jgi:hypothetical protein
MRRIVSLTLASMLTLAGLVLLYYEFMEPHPAEAARINGKILLGAFFILGVGLMWIWSDIKDWND